MPMKELLESKHPTAWVEFEEGLIDEVYLLEMILLFFFFVFSVSYEWDFGVSKDRVAVEMSD